MLAILGFAIPLLLGAGLAAHVVRERRQAAATMRDFEARWAGRVRVFAPCQVWRAGQRRAGVVGLGAGLLALRAAGTSEDLTMPLALVKQGGVSKKPGGKTVLDLSVSGDRLFVEVPEEFVGELLSTLARG